MTFFQPPHVHLAVIEGDVVLLDAGRDRYASIPASEAETLRAGVPTRQWPEGSLESDLAAEGFLTATAPSSVSRPPAPAVPTEDLYSLPIKRPTSSMPDLCDVVIAGVATAIRLRTQKPSRWLDRTLPDALHDDACIIHSRRFAQARLYVPLLSRCLPNSLALLHFLEARHCPGQLVFGVRTHPFEAHCWLQHGETVLNDTLDHVLWYTPIAWT